MYYNKIQLIELLRIGPRFLFIDEAEYSERDKSVVTKYCLKEDHWIFESHLLGNPVFPGNLLSELACQSAMVNAYQDVVSNYDRGLLRSVNFTFFKKIEFYCNRNQTLLCTVDLMEKKRGISKFQAKIYLNTKANILICAGDIVHSISLVHVKKSSV
jgi:3-hydroxymyristoyl/3-hydroxydecanoyl-(acyl carrier protein) dehydratase